MLFLKVLTLLFSTNTKLKQFIHNKTFSMEQQEETSQHFGGIYNYFEGATIHNLVINGNLSKSGNEYYNNTGEKPQYSDAQVCKALCNIVGKGKPIDSKQKWAGALWLLHWRCGYPVKAQDFCERIEALPLPEDLEYKCDYRNIRELATLSFIGEDATHMDSVRYSKNDEVVFRQLRSVALALDNELSRSKEMKL